MKRTNITTASVFMTAAVLGSLLVGSGVGAQTTTTTPLSCNFALPSVRAGQPAVLTATGGNGTYTWSSPGLVIANPNGSSFAATFNVPGTYPVTVTSGGLTSTCSVTVTAASGTPTTTPDTTPGLPSTGERAD